MACDICKKKGDTRFGVCIDCASLAEEKAAKRTVIQHLKKCWANFKSKKYTYAKYDLRWAFQRLFLIGDYAKDGIFKGYDWR
jgi:hypothetical protein